MHWTAAQSHWTPPRRHSCTREVAASHLVSPSRLQVARQSYILEVSHIHLCDWRRSLPRTGISSGTLCSVIEYGLQYLYLLLSP